MERKIAILFILMFCSLENVIASCSYEYSVYNVRARKSLKRIKVRKDKPDKRDALGCSLCREEQVNVTLQNGVSFLICEKIAEHVSAILNDEIKKGFPIKEVVGYRSQMSRGKVDSEGNRTEFSNHSFGSAIDINPKANGLFDQCVTWGSHCRLRKGGPWLPHSNPYSIKPNSSLVKKMKEIGLKWGGELFGRQKDFMHFSLSGG